MTSQVALLNPHGVALASDSAVSLGQKTFNTVNKIFPLESDRENVNHHVAFMVSNSGAYIPGDVLWERVFDSFSKTLRKTEPTLEKYVSKLLKYLQQKDMFNDTQNNLAVQRVLLNWFENLPEVSGLGALKSAISWQYVDNLDVGHLTEEMRSAIEQGLEDVIETKHKEYEQRKATQKASPSATHWNALYNSIKEKHEVNSLLAAERIVNQHDLHAKFVDLLVDIFNIQLALDPGKLGRYHRELRSERPPRSAEAHFFQRDWRLDYTTTIVVIGFGEEDNTPVMYEMLCGPHIDPNSELIKVRQRFSIRRSVDLEDMGDLAVDENGFAPVEKDAELKVDVTMNTGGAIIRGFAFTNEMDNVLNGFHNNDMAHVIYQMPKIMDFSIQHKLDTALKNTPQIGSTRIKNIKKSIEDQNILDYLRQETFNAIMQHGQVRRRQKFREAIEFFPIPNLADFAHSLVRMEAEISYWLSAHRAVGGPIDVLTITKEHGCRWKKNESNQ